MVKVASIKQLDMESLECNMKYRMMQSIAKHKFEFQST